jgi:XTP/dITP diphosphohydrolase
VTRFLVATRNRGKQAEFQALLVPARAEIVFPDDVNIPESAAEQHLECHDTFEANARAKARWFAERSGLLTLADDSGLEVDALDGAPGVRSKRFAGIDGPDSDVTAANIAMLLAALSDVADDARTARYRCSLVLARPDGTELVANGVVSGHILRVARGTNGFGYDPLFLSDELGETFGEASEAAKHAVSHRGRAVEALRRYVDRIGREGHG